MTQLTVISLGDRTLNVVSARSAATASSVTSWRKLGGVELLRVMSATLPEDLAERPAAERADAIHKALIQCGGGNGRTAVVVPRAMAIVREFDVPSGPPEDVAQMARFQVEREMPLPIEHLYYSYVATPRSSGKIHISVAAVPKEQLDPLINTLEGIGCKVQAAYVSSFGLASLLPLETKKEGSSALVALTEGAAEILVVEEGALALSRSVPMREVSHDSLATEVNRTVLSYGARGNASEIKRIFVAGEGEGAARLVEGLRGRLSPSVEGLLVNGTVTRRPNIVVSLETAAAVGVCVGVLSDQDSVPNVLKTPVMRKRFRLRPAQRIGILCGMLLVGLVIWSRMALADRRSELEQVRAQLKQIEPQAQSIMQIRLKAQLAAQWAENRYPWIDVFGALQEKIDPTKTWLSILNVDESGTMRIQGKATDDNHVEALVGALQKNTLFKKVEGEYTRPNRDKSGYKFDFAIRIQLAGWTTIKKAK